MGQKMINVKPIKNKETLIQFGKELKKGKHGKRDFLIMAIGIKTGLRISDILNLGVCQYSCRIFIFHLSKSGTSLWSVGLVTQ